MEPSRWLKIKEIFNASVDLPQEGRVDFVSEACAGDEELAAEVLELLSHHDIGGYEPRDATRTVAAFVTGTGSEDMIGRRIGAYRIESEIGRGGMGNVYLAKRADDEFEKAVAVKLIKRGFDTDEIVTRFRHERSILASLDHPYITKLIDGGSTEDGRPYLVMEYVHGRPLRAYCEEESPSIEERLEIFLKICSAVSFAHSNLVIHRDLKPSNIFITEDGSPKLLDFGIAKLLSPSDGGVTDGTVNAFRAMTPDYASPEQLTGSRMTLASDVYSLGVIFFEMLTGIKPHRLPAGPLEAVVKSLEQEEAPRPSSVVEGTEAAAQRLARRLRGDLDNIILMALRKEPQRRYASVDAFAADIRRHLAGMPVKARRDTFGYRAGKFVQRNKAGVIAGAGIGASILFALIATSRQADRARRERDRALKEARKAATVNRFAKKMVTSVDPSRSGKDVRFLDVVTEMEAALDRDFADQPEILAELRLTIGMTYVSLGIFDRAEDHLRESLRLRLLMFPRLSAEVAESIAGVGKVLHASGRIKEAEPLYLEALRIFREVRGPHSLRGARVLTELGHLLALSGRHEESIARQNEALAIKRRILGPDDLEVAISLAEIGNVFGMMLSRFSEAEPYHREALRIGRLKHKGDHPEVARFLLYLGSSLHDKDPKLAAGYASQSLEMRRRLFGDAHPDVAWAAYNIGYYCVKEGDADEAVRRATSVVEMTERGLPREHAVVNSSLLLLGRGYLLKGMYGEALAAFDECLELRRKTLPVDHWLLSTTDSFRGYCMARSGRVGEGVELMSRSCEVLGKALGPEHAQTKEALARLSEFSPSEN